ncbi:hypothetical protein G6O69_02175 [Pseudenhygromyxa sp. WMMC2535]|uniref:peptide-N-glycosidase F-related protein n=1 Tax=Pseudenhygromyxa sp. WMMC2535 TaxID=2712867 RepID=UPI00159586E2|nr:peptide-N-glycosidase F-related protein [Pseudenhygromyxa sp. WMMC2535]NVB36622.1 hypothetical protein [Pseudenhygromyxa sp. WMMC2535]
MKDKPAFGTTVFVLGIALSACQSGDDGGGADEVGTTSGGESEGGSESESGTGADTETDTGETETDTGDTGESGACFDGLERYAWDASASEVGYDLPAPDFSVKTLRDDAVSFSELWTGCDNHVFVIYAGNWWSTSIDELVDDSAENTHYWFVVAADDAALDEDTRTGLMLSLAQRIEGYLEELGPEVHEAMTDRFHYVVDSGLDIPVVAGIHEQNANEAHFTVDRHQLVREGHNVRVYSGSWVPLLGQTRYWAKYFNGQYQLDASLAEQAESQDVLVHRVADGVEIKGGEPYEWVLPDAAEIADYDKLEIDMHIDCPGEGHPYGSTCGEWDTIASIFLCGDDECTGENRRRVVKWITPYSAPGRWLIDITPELLHLYGEGNEGGALQFVSAHGDNDVGQYTYRYTVDLRFGHAEDGLRPIAKQTLISRGGYGWNENFHANWDDFAFEAPEGTEKVELYARISGHGSADGTSCAEFCTFTHSFAVNDQPFEHQYKMESANRCAEWVEQGVTPNQGGTWFYDRSSWCPGWVTEEWREDVTDAVLFGEQNTVDYTSWYSTATDSPPPGGTMNMRVELVFYGQG